MSSLVNLQNFGAASSRYDFPPPPIIPEQNGESSELPHIATSEEPDESAANESAGGLLRRVADVVAAWRLQLPRSLGGFQFQTR